MDLKHFLSVSDLMKLFQVSRTTIWRMQQRGDIPPPCIQSPPRWSRKQVMAIAGVIDDGAECTQSRAFWPEPRHRRAQRGLK